MLDAAVVNAWIHIDNNDVQSLEKLLQNLPTDRMKDIIFGENKHIIWQKAGDSSCAQLLDYLLGECGADADTPNCVADMPQEECERICELGRTPLLHAIHEDHLENVEVLVKHGASVNAVADKLGKYINPPLIHACQELSPSIDTCGFVKFLIENGAKVNLRNHDGLTALHWALRNHKHDVIKLLIKCGAEFYSVPSVDVVPYVYACSRRSEDGKQTLEKLLQHFTIDQRKEIIFKEDKKLIWKLAGECGSEYLLEYLLDECEAEVNTLNFSPDMLLDKWRIMAELGPTPILHAMNKGNYINVQVLVRGGADLNALIGKFGVYVNPSLIFICKTELFTTIDTYKLVRYFIANGAKVNLRNHEGLTALHYAIRNKWKAIIHLLLENGAEFYPVPFVDVVSYVEECAGYDDDTDTLERLLHNFIRYQRKEIIFREDTNIIWRLAGKHGSTRMLEYLLDNCAATPNCVATPNYIYRSEWDDCGPDSIVLQAALTPLLHAIYTGNYDNIKVLVKYCADVNALTDKFGKSIDPSLIYACRYPKWCYCKQTQRMEWNENEILVRQQRKKEAELLADVVKLLIQNGADVHLRNHEGLTALHYAARNNSHDLIQVLLNSGAEHHWGGRIGVLIYTGLFADQETMKFLIENTQIQPDGVIADAYEVLGARTFLTGGNHRQDISEVATYWKKAMAIRYRNNEHPSLKTLQKDRTEFLQNEREPQTMKELLELLPQLLEEHQGPDMKYQDISPPPQTFLLGINALLIYKRVIGEDMPEFIDTLQNEDNWIIRNPMYTENKLTLLKYALSLCLKHDYTSERLISILGDMVFLHLFEHDRHGLVMDTLKILGDAATPGKKLNVKLNSSFEKIMVYINDCLFYLIYLMEAIKTIDDDCVRNNNGVNVVDPYLMSDILKFLNMLSNVNPLDKRNNYTLLHVALAQFSDRLGEFYVEGMSHLGLLKLLVNSGFDIDWRDDNGETCLMKAIDRTAIDDNIVGFLLDAGSHGDIRNKFGDTYMDNAQRRAQRRAPSYSKEIVTKINIYPEINLMCLSARALADSGTPYDDVAPKNLLPFINMHNKNKWSV